MITVYGTSNTRAFRVLWMLEELGVPDSSVASLLITTRSRQHAFSRIRSESLYPNGVASLGVLS